jgi:hypothetical protein
MLKGQIALIPHPKNWFQRAIEIVTRSPVHHCIVCYDDDDNVASAEIPRVVSRPASAWPDAVWSHFELTDAQASDIANFAKAQIGKKYSLIDDLLIAVSIVTKTKTPHWIQDRLMDSGQWQCAELADASLLAGNVNVFRDGRPACAVYPGSFIATFRANGWWPSYLDTASR